MTSPGDTPSPTHLPFGAQFDSYPDILTISEAASFLRLSYSDMQNLIDHGAVRSLKILEKVLVPKKFLMTFLENSLQLEYTQATEANKISDTEQHLDNNINVSSFMPFSEGETEMVQKVVQKVRRRVVQKKSTK